MTTFTKITCPHCGKRLFDTTLDAVGTVAIKCPRCKTFTYVDLKSYPRASSDASQSQENKQQ